ncbi:MAG: hypothetical protein J5762_04180 [Clostridia bacterium]|nr:hypothetical protein [Clostridia bacterium]
MKKTIRSLTFILIFAFTVFAGVKTVNAQTQYEVDGWRKTVTFDTEDDTNQFALFTEFDKSPFYMDGRLYFWTLAEQKAIFTQRKYNDLDVSADFGTINDHGKFDVGFYVHANKIGSAMDNIDAWNVNLERGADDKTYNLRLHRFYNKSWVGYVTEAAGIKLPMNEVHLRVVVKSGTLYAFVNYESRPRLTYYIGESEGYVGFRCFYSPNWVDNFSIVGEGNAMSEELYATVNELKDFDTAGLTAKSAEAIEAAKEALNDAEGQYRTEEAVAAAEKAINKAVIKRTADELGALIQTAESTVNVGYTVNSWNSLQAVLSISKTVDTSDEEAVSYWANRLERKLALLVRYKKEV